MSLIDKTTNFIQNLNRPIGVSLVILYMVAFAGLAPFAVGVMPFFSLEARIMYKLSNSQLILTLLFVLIVIGSGIGVWLGNNIARYVFLIGITLYCANISSGFIQTVIEISSYPDYLQGENVSYWPFLKAAFRQFVLIGISWWAFHTKKAKRFFQSSSTYTAVQQLT